MAALDDGNEPVRGDACFIPESSIHFQCLSNYYQCTINALRNPAKYANFEVYMNKSNEFMQDNGPGKKSLNGANPANGAIKNLLPKTSLKPEQLTKKAPLNSALKYDEAMKQQQKTLPTMDEIKARWKEQVGAAMIVWDRLTESELLATHGHKKQLVDLLQEYHAFSRDEANKQVNSFFEKHMC